MVEKRQEEFEKDGVTVCTPLCFYTPFMYCLFFPKYILSTSTRIYM